MNPLSILAEGIPSGRFTDFITILDGMVNPREGIPGLTRTEAIVRLLHDAHTAAALVDTLRANGWQDDTALVDYLTGRLQPQGPEEAR